MNGSSDPAHNVDGVRIAVIKTDSDTSEMLLDLIKCGVRWQNGPKNMKKHGT